MTAEGRTIHLADAWEKLSRTIPDRPAVIHGDRIITWREFDDRASRVAAALVAHGVQPGETVAIDLYNGNEYLEIWLAALKIRAVPANVNYRYFGAELAQLLDSMEATVFAFHRSLTDRVRDTVAQRDFALTIEVDDVGTPPGLGADYESLVAGHAPADPVERHASDRFLSFTGGTTGLPKAVEWSMGGTVDKSVVLAAGLLGLPDDVWSMTIAERALRLHEADALPVCLTVSPLMHGTGLQMAAVPTLTTGGAVVTMTSRSFLALEVLAAAARHRATSISIVGDVFARPILDVLQRQSPGERERDFAALRTITSAGTLWSPAVKRELMACLPEVQMIDVVGSTEGATIGLQVSSYSTGLPGERVFEPTPGLKLLRDDESEIPSHSREVGVFCGPTPAVGYHHDPDATAKVFRLLDGDQYVIVGDLGQWNSDGTIQLIGRGSSVVNTGGEKVFPEEVESALRSLPDVTDCVVVGVPDATYGERVGAVIELGASADTSESAIRDQLRSRLAGYKIPHEIRLSPVPRGPNGKAIVSLAVEMLRRNGPVPR